MADNVAATQYQIFVRTPTKDLTEFLTKIRIVNSIFNCWPIVDLTFALDNQEIIENNIYGQEPIEVEIHVTRENGELNDEPLTLQLLYLESDLDLPPKPQNNVGGDMNDYQKLKTTIRTIPFTAVNVMSAFINKLWEEPTVKIPLDFVKEILELRGFDGDSIIEDAGKNEIATRMQKY